MSRYPHSVSYFINDKRMYLTEDEFTKKMYQFFNDVDVNLGIITSSQSRQLVTNHYWYNVILPGDGRNVEYNNEKSVLELMRLYDVDNFVASIMANESNYRLVGTIRYRKSKTGAHNLDFDGDSVNIHNTYDRRSRVGTHNLDFDGDSVNVHNTYDRRSRTGAHNLDFDGDSVNIHNTHDHRSRVGTHNLDYDM